MRETTVSRDVPIRWRASPSMADNDLALGRIVLALSQSSYWKDTVIFVVEDDAQAGPDQTDSHCAPFYAISPYNRPGTVYRFINTTDVIAAIEDILGMGGGTSSSTTSVNPWQIFSRRRPTRRPMIQSSPRKI